MADTKRRYSKEELARRGDAIYEKKVRPQLKVSDQDRFATIDIESGEFAVDADELKACRKLRKRIPDAQIWMVRVGYPYVHRIGGRERQESP
jgi:23S rRNA maturation mini-RNase III